MSERPFRLTVDARFAAAGGIGTYLQQLVPRLARLRGHWSITALGNPDVLRETLGAAPNINFRECNAAHYGVAEQVALLTQNLADADVFWAPHYNFPVFARVPVVVTIHDVCHLARPEATTSPLQRLYARFMHDRVGRQAAAVLSDSEFTRSEIHRLVPDFRAPVTVAPLAVDDSWLSARPSSRPPGIERPYVVYVGNFKRHKNVAALVRAFARVMHRFPHELLLVGRSTGSNADPDVLTVVREVGPRVRLVGEASGDQLRAYMMHADALATASLYEGFGLPPLEAMAVGCACLVSRAGSLPEVCGDAALYCEPESLESVGDGLVRILTDEPLRRDLRARGLARAKMFSWDRCAQVTGDVLEGVRR